MITNNFIFELKSYTFFDVIGDDSEKFLQGQLSVNVLKLTTNTAQLATLCNPKGRIVALFYVYRLNNGFRFVLPRDTTESAMAHLKKYAIFFKINMEPAEDGDYLIVIDTNAAEKINPLMSSERIVVKIPTTGFSLIASNDDKELAIFAESSSCKELDSDEHWYWQLATNRIPWLTETSCEQFLPHNLNLPKLTAIDFNKGCFTGQEVIARMQYKGKLKQHMQLLKTDQKLELPPMEKLLQQDKKVAEVICSVNMENQGSLVLALVKDSCDQGKILQSTATHSELSFASRTSD